MRALGWLAVLGACTGSDTEFRTLTGELVLTPAAPLDYGEVVVGETGFAELYVANAGPVDLTATLALDAVGFTLPPTELVLAPDASETVTVAFTPLDFTDYLGEILVQSDDPDHPALTYAVQGTGRPVPVPDIDAPTATLDFGTVAVGESALRVIEITNVGEADLHLGAFGQDGSGAFTVQVDPTGATIAPGASWPLILVYAPTSDAGDAALLRLPSDDPDEPELAIPLTGNGGADPADFPLAAIRWGAPGDAPVLPCPAAISPVAELPLSGADSSDPAGLLPLTHAWQVVDAPIGAQGTFDDPTGANTALLVDVAGDWTVSLQVTNTAGVTSAPARCLVTAVPTEDIRVELSWDGPTADLDLHLADAIETPLYAVPGDVSPCNANPDWGAAGIPGDDPLLGQDDASGYGPEALTLVDASDGSFPVRVHYFARNADFAVHATVRVWLAGQLAYSGSAVLDYNAVWEVGWIQWPSATFAVAAGAPTLADARQCE